MTVYIEKPAVNLREELASLRNQGGYEEQQFYFDGLVTNGTFDANTSGWTAQTAFSLSVVSQEMNVAYTSGAGGVWYQGATQVITTMVGKSYTIRFDVTAVSSNLGRVRVETNLGGGQNLNAGSLSVGSYAYTFVATATTTYINLSVQSDATGSVTYDNISVYETDGTDVVHRMPKGWVPLHVYEDGLLQREGAANDYEVVYDGFDYYVKPAVAPSATTQTCVIGVRK